MRVNIKISRDEIGGIIKSAAGRFETVTFEKKDGTKRKMNGRLGVHRYLKGGKSTQAGHKNLMSFYDIQARGYRTINLDTVLEVTVNGNTYVVDRD